MQRITLDSEISYVITEKELKEIRADERARTIDECLEIVKFHKNYCDGIHHAISEIEQMKGGANFDEH